MMSRNYEELRRFEYDNADPESALNVYFYRESYLLSLLWFSEDIGEEKYIGKTTERYCVTITLLFVFCVDERRALA